jgi:hypothetical protein
MGRRHWVKVPWKPIGPRGRMPAVHRNRAARVPAYPLLRLPAVGDNAAMQDEPSEAEPPDNLAMSKPFQFSMRRMLGAVAWFCLAAWLAALYWRHLDDNIALRRIGYFGVSAAAGAGFGTLAGKPIRYAAWGIVLAFLVACIASAMIRQEFGRPAFGRVNPVRIRPADASAAVPDRGCRVRSAHSIKASDGRRARGERIGIDGAA